MEESPGSWCSPRCTDIWYFRCRDHGSRVHLTKDRKEIDCQAISAWNRGPVNENAKHLTPLPYQATVAFFFVPRVHRTKATHIVLYRLHQWKGLLLYFFGLFASMNLAIIKMVTIFTRNQEKAQLGNGEGPTCPYIKLRETCHPWPGRNRRSKSTTSLRSCIEHAF